VTATRAPDQDGKKIGLPPCWWMLTGTRDLVLYEDILQRFEELLKSDDPLLVRGGALAREVRRGGQQEPAAEPLRRSR